MNDTFGSDLLEAETAVAPTALLRGVVIGHHRLKPVAKGSAAATRL